MNSNNRYERNSTRLSGDDMRATKGRQYFDDDENLEPDPSSSRYHQTQTQNDNNNPFQFEQANSLMDSFQDKTQGSVETCAPNTSEVICINDYLEADTKKSIDILRSSRYLFHEKSLQMQSNFHTLNSPTNKFLMSPPQSISRFPGGIDDLKSNRILTNITNLSESTFMSRDDFPDFKSRGLRDGHENKTPMGFASPQLLENSKILKKEQEALKPSQADQREDKANRKMPGPEQETKEIKEKQRNTCTIVQQIEADTGDILARSHNDGNRTQPHSILKKSPTMSALISPQHHHKAKSNQSAGTFLVDEALGNKIAQPRISYKGDGIAVSRGNLTPTVGESKPPPIKPKEIGTTLERIQTSERYFDVAPRSISGTRSVRSKTPSNQRFSEKYESRYVKSMLVPGNEYKLKEEPARVDQAASQAKQRVCDEALSSSYGPRNDLCSSKKENESKMANLKATVTALEEKNFKLEKENLALQSELNSIRKTLKESNTKLAQLEQARSDLLLQNQDLVKQYHNYVDELEAELSRVQKENSQLRRDLMSLKDEKDRISKKYLSKIEKYQDMTQKAEQEMRTMKERCRVQDTESHTKFRQTRGEDTSQGKKRPKSSGREYPHLANQTSMVDSMGAQLDAKALGNDCDNRDLAHQYKSMQKFVDSITDMVVECSPQGFWKEKPSLKQVWKWIKNIMVDYIELKRRGLDTSEDSEIVQTCLEFLMLRTKADVIPSLHSLLVESNKMSQVISKFKIINSVTSIETLDELESVLNRQLRSGRNNR